jgi:hypothetical protein
MVEAAELYNEIDQINDTAVINSADQLCAYLPYEVEQEVLFEMEKSLI